MDDIRKAQDFIHALFTDEGVSVDFHIIPQSGQNELHMMVSFTDNITDQSYTTYYKPGCMRDFLERIKEIDRLFTRDTELISVPTSAIAALEYIK